MKLKKFKLQYITLLLAFLMLPIASGPVNADVTPVIPLNTSQQKFNPTVDGNYSQYLVPSNYKNFGINYHGNATATNPRAQYTDGTSGSSVSLVTPGLSLTNNGPLSSTLSNSQSTGTYNPYLPADSIPVFVNMSDNQAYFTKQNSVSFSVHMGQSSTIFFNSSIVYYLLVNSSSPFFLDVNVFNPNANIYLNLSQTLYPGQANVLVNKKQSIPVIPTVDGVQVINVTTQNSQNSLVTFTPLPFTVNTFGSTQVAEGQYYSDKVNQGSCTDLQTTANYDSQLKTLGMKFFQFPVTADNTYQLYFYQNSIYDNSGSTYIDCPAGGMYAARLDASYKFNYEGGSLYSSDTGLVVNAKTDGLINITLISYGYVREDYGFFFQQANSFKIPKQHDLAFNKPISLLQSPNDFYTFTLQTPSMLAINYTATATINPNLYFSKLNDQTGKYQLISNYFPLERNNLLNDSSSDLLYNPSIINWVYLPAGQYRFDTNGTVLTNHPEAEFEFNLVPVQTFQNSINLNIKDKGIYAVQLPYNPIGYNYINASTTSQDNTTVFYRWGVIGAYRYFSSLSDNVPINYGSFQLGNRLLAGGWTAYNANQTSILHIDKKTMDNYVPIMLITPSYAHKWNNSAMDVLAHTFSTILTITSNTNSSIHVNTGVMGSGNLITSANTISNSATVNVNDDSVTGQNQLYAFKVSTTPNTLYKLSISTLGNYTTTNPNVLINTVYVASGNLISTSFYERMYSLNTSYEYRGEFISASSTSYLFISVSRQINNTVFQNATMNIDLTNLNVKPLSIQSLSNFNWNSTISKLEVQDTTPLWNITDYKYPGSGGGIDLGAIALVGGGVVVIAAIGGGAYYFTKKRGKHP